MQTKKSLSRKGSLRYESQRHIMDINYDIKVLILLDLCKFSSEKML